MKVKVGVLMHARHPNTMNWEELVWGVPAEDRLGDLTALVELILREVPQKPIACIVTGSTETIKEGLLDGVYTKKYLLDHFNNLRDFPRLNVLINKLPPGGLAKVRKRLEDMIVTTPLKNTADEIVHSARIFSEQGIKEVIQVTSASHGPRCVQLQAIARADGDIPAGQLWLLVISDMCFGTSKPKDTLVVETPHRGDDPMLGFSPTLSEALQPYFYNLSLPNKKQLNLQIKDYMDKHSQK
ncbi:MAG: hypothetical protein ACREGD_02610 [Candidatus Saccharimonadales bacterium]